MKLNLKLCQDNYESHTYINSQNQIKKKNELDMLLQDIRSQNKKLVLKQQEQQQQNQQFYDQQSQYNQVDQMMEECVFYSKKFFQYEGVVKSKLQGRILLDREKQYMKGKSSNNKNVMGYDSQNIDNYNFGDYLKNIDDNDNKENCEKKGRVINQKQKKGGNSQVGVQLDIQDRHLNYRKYKGNQQQKEQYINNGISNNNLRNSNNKNRNQKEMVIVEEFEETQKQVENKLKKQNPRQNFFLSLDYSSGNQQNCNNKINKNIQDGDGEWEQIISSLSIKNKGNNNIKAVKLQAISSCHSQGLQFFFVDQGQVVYLKEVCDDQIYIEVELEGKNGLFFRNQFQVYNGGNNDNESNKKKKKRLK